MLDYSIIKYVDVNVSSILIRHTLLGNSFSYPNLPEYMQELVIE